MVGVSGFEPEASWTRTKRDTKLRHTPIAYDIIMKYYPIVKPRDNFLLYYTYPICHARILRQEVYTLGYSIEYGASGTFETRWQTNRKKRRKAVVTMFLLGIITLVLIFSGRIKAVQDFLIPGNPEITRAAFTQFTEDIRQGNRFDDAIYTFCKEIIDHASIPG